MTHKSTPTKYFSLGNYSVDWYKIFQLDPGELTGLGLQQCYQLGTRIREIYLQQNSSQYIDDISREYNTRDYKFYSSYKERAVQSAWVSEMVFDLDGKAGSMGLFPKGRKVHGDGRFALPNGTEAVPIHTLEEINDLWLKAYDNCPKYE